LDVFLGLFALWRFFAEKFLMVTIAFNWQNYMTLKAMNTMPHGKMESEINGVF